MLGPRPDALPLPLQTVHVSSRRIFTSISVPKTACSKSIERSKRKSSPRCVREPRDPPCAPPTEQIAEDVAQVNAAPKGAAAESLRAQAGMTKAVIRRAFVRVAKHLVGLAG